MAWFTSGQPVVQVDKSLFEEEYITPTPPQARWKRTVSVTGYEARGLTKTAANAYASGISSDTDISGVSVYPIGGGGHTVRFSYTTRGDWGVG